MEPKELYEMLHGDELYTGSYEQFKLDYGSEKGQAELHSMLKSDGLYTGDLKSFKSDYFAPVKKKVSTKPSAFDWETGTVDVQKLSSTQPAAPTAGKRSDIVVKDGVEMNWGTGEVTPKSAFQKNAESVYQLITTDSVKQAFQEETSQNEGVSKPVTFSEAAMAGVESINKGFYEQAIGGTLKGAGELMLKGVKLLDKTARPEDIWLWQAGDALQKQFQEGGIAEPTSDPALLESDLGQISAGIGQMAAMILTGGTSAEGQAMAKIPQMTSVLKTASKQFFSRPAMMGTMQMIGDGSDKIREEKKVVDNMDRDTYVKINVEVGMDPKLAGKKYDKLKESSADDLISEMLPTWFMEGSTEGFVVGEWFKRFNKATGGSFGKVFMEKAKDVTVGTFEGAAQEALQQWMDNATAKEVYDYTLSTTEGMAQSAKVGGAVQFIFETISAALGVKNRNASADDKVFLDKAQEAIKQREQELARNLENTLTDEVKIEDVKAELDKKVQAGEMKQEEADAEIKDIEAKKEALQKIPEEHKTNPDVVDATTEKTKIDKETETLKEEIKTKDPAFTAEEQAKIKENELKSAELSVKASEAAGLAPDPKAVKLLEAQKESVSEEGGARKEGKVQEVPPVSEKQPMVKKESDLSIEEADAIIKEGNRLWEEIRNKELEAISDKLIAGKLDSKQYINEVRELDKRFSEANPEYYKYDNGIKPSDKMQNAIDNFYEKGSKRLLENVGKKLEEIFDIKLSKEQPVVKTTAKEDISSSEPQEQTVFKAKNGAEVFVDTDGKPTSVMFEGAELTGKKRTNAINEWVESNIDKVSTSGSEVDLTDVPENQHTAEILRSSTNPAQIAGAWVAEPATTDPKEDIGTALRIRVGNEKFTRDSLIDLGIPAEEVDTIYKDLIWKPESERELPEKKTKSVRNADGTITIKEVKPKKEALPYPERPTNAREFLEDTLNKDEVGTFGSVSNDQLLDAINANIEQGVPDSKSKPNPAKKALAEKFAQVTGGASVAGGLAGKVADRGGFLKEKQAVEQEFPEAKDTKPVQSASQRMKKSLLNRVVEDPLIPLEIREKAKKGELEYDVLTDEHVNAVADFEISENMKSMDVKDGLDASVKTAKELLKEAVDTEDSNTRETNGAVATTILLKAAFNYAEQGMMAEALAVYDFLDSYSRGAGRQISSLRGSATPEGVAGRVAVKAFESQVRELSKKGKNQTLEQMLKDLRKEIEKARSKANLQEAKVAAAKKTGAKIAASQKVEAAKKSVDEARAKLASVVRGKLSAGIDPEVLVALKDLFIAYKNLLGANLSLIKTAYMEAAAEMGLDADEAWNAVNDLVEATKAEEDQRMPELPVGEQMNISQQTKEEEGTETVEEPQGAIDKIVDEHYKNPDGRTLASKLTEAGMTEKDARNYEDTLAKELEKKERASVLKAIQNFKEKVRQEEIEGIKIHESKWNGSVDKLSNAVFHGLLDDQNLAASVAGYFGFNALTTEDVQDIKDISSKIINGLQSNAVVNPQGKIVGYQPIGQPAPAGMTLQPVTGKSPELIARAQKEMKTKLLQIEKRNNGIMPLLAGELQTAMHMGALANTGTWYNVAVGTMWASLPSLIGLSIANPIAAVNAIKTITKSKANEWSRGWGVFRDAFYSNFSTLNSHSIYFEGQYTSHASLLEAVMLHGMRKQAQKISKATGTDFLREMAIGIPRLLIQAYRIASAPMAIDGLLTHPVSEYVRYIEAWNKISEEHKLNNLTNSEIANIVAKYGQFTEHAWGLAKQQAAAEVAGMKASGKEIPLDFESRRAKEIIHQNVRRAELESAFAFVEKASLRGEMTGRLGVGYDWLMSAANREKVGENWHWSLKIPLLIKNAIFMFLRVAIQGANFIEKTVPVAPMLYNPFLASLSTGKEVARRARAASANPDVVNRMAANKVLSKLIPPEKQAFISSMMSDLMSKYVGEDRMKEYPEDRQLGRGFVTKSATEKSVDIALQAMTTTLMVGLAASMFDRDDEDNLILDPDRWIDVSASLDNDPFTNESNDGMKKYSVRYRQSDGTWSSPSSFALWLPFVSGLSILGGIRDDIMYREEKRKDKDVVGNMGAASMDIIGALGEMSFNGNAQSVGKIMKANKQAAAEDSPAPYGTAIADIAMRPFKAVVPGVYRDLFVNELGAMGVDPIANKPQGLVEQMMKDIPMLDNFIGNDRYDEYGNPIYRESKPLKILERMSFNYMDFVTMNEKTRKQPEWVLTSKFEGMSTPGQYYPARSLKVKKEVDGRIKGEKITEEDRTLMSEAVAKRKGLIVNKYYEQLNRLNKQELEQMLYKIHNFAGDIIKFEMGYSSDKRKPEFDFGDVKKSVKEKIKKEQ